MHSTTWNDDCNDYVFVSNDVETGRAWTPGFSTDNVFVATIPWDSHTRQLTPLQGGDVLHAWDDGISPVGDSNVMWSTTTSGEWAVGGGGEAVFPDAGDVLPTSFYDWSMCRRTALEADLVRRDSADGGTSSDHFDYYRLTTGSTAWVAGEPLANDPGRSGTGVVTLTNGTSVLVFAIASDFAIHFARWSAGVWSPWAVAVPAPASNTRWSLTGTGCEDTSHAVLLWTEGDAAYELVALDVANLF